MKKLFFLFLVSFNIVSAQIAINPGDVIKEDFNNVGNSASALLPLNWKVEKSTSIKTIGSYFSADNKTNYAGGINLSSSAGNGVYNFEVGNGSTPTNRAIGGLSSGSGSRTVNIFVFFKNTSNQTIKQVDVSYEVMRFRNGSNSAGFSIQLYYSKNGMEWNSGGEKFTLSFAPNENNNGAAIVPIEQKQILNQPLSELMLAPNDSLFFALSYSVANGTTTTNAQALGIDNFVMNNISTGETTSAPLSPKIKKASDITSNSFIANWESSASATNYYLDVSTTLDFSSFISGYNNLDAGNVLSKEITSLQPNVKYYYRVRAGNAAGVSNNSDTEFLTTDSILTKVQFKGISDAVSKMKGRYELPILITNPSSTFATTCTITYFPDSSSATSSYLNNFSSQTITFPAGISEEQKIVLNIVDNKISEIPKRAFFKITNVSGGISAKVGNNVKFLLSITSGIDKEYYKTFPANLNGKTLKDSLHSLIKNNVKFDYSSIWNILKNSDEDPKNINNVIGIYSGISISKEPHSYWNREHVWSKSHGNFGTEIGAGTDAHHLRPENPSVNNLKSNLDFDNGGIPVPGAPNCKYDNNSWEPRDEVKGDIARMIFYMATRYIKREPSDSNFVVVDYIPSSPKNEARYGKLNTLLQWNLQDPPDDFEINRNNIIYSFQKNRNPFIDFPEWVTAIWGNPTSINNKKEIVYNYSLNQNYPNPFNPSTTIEYTIPVEIYNSESLQKVTLIVYDVLGREVATLVNEYKQAGKYKTFLNVESYRGMSLPSGVYLYRLQAGSFVQTKRMILLK